MIQGSPLQPILNRLAERDIWVLNLFFRPFAGSGVWQANLASKDSCWEFGFGHTMSEALEIAEIKMINGKIAPAVAAPQASGEARPTLGEVGL